MKKIWQLLKKHIAADFNLKLYGALGIFLALIVSFNYAVNFENGVIDKYTGREIRILWYFLEMSFVYFVAAGLVFYFNNTLHHFKSPRFWLIIIVALVFLAIDLGFPYTRQIANRISGGDYWTYRWSYGIVNNLTDFFIQAMPLFVFAWFFEKQRENFGVNGKNIDLKPYWQILMIVAPLVIIASFEDGFRHYYPMYHKYEIPQEKNMTGISPWLLGLWFEIAYGMDFFNVEFLFRGALVIGVSQVIGKEAILPMVSAYCALHFGKPLGECISSIFGGYILGVVAFYTRNIWGGVIVHMGLAWMMEIVAFLQKAINS